MAAMPTRRRPVRRPDECEESANGTRGKASDVNPEAVDADFKGQDAARARRTSDRGGDGDPEIEAGRAEDQTQRRPGLMPARNGAIARRCRRDTVPTRPVSPVLRKDAIKAA